MFNVCPSTGPFHDSGLPAVVVSSKEQPLLFEELSREAQAELIQYVFDDETPIEWTDDTIVRLHFMLLDDCEKLADPQTPLEEKLEVLRWIYTDPQKDDAPFSFANCLKLFGRPTDQTQGSLGPKEVREGLRGHLSGWIRESLERYPAWVREAFHSNPDHVSELLARNAQRINEEVRRRSAQGDLFADSFTATSGSTIERVCTACRGV